MSRARNSRREAPVDHRAGQKEEPHGGEGQADHEQAGGEEVVQPVGEGDRLDAHQALGRGPDGRPPGDVEVVTAPHPGVELDRGRRQQGDADGTADQGQHRGTQGGPVGGGPEIAPVDHQDGQHHQGQDGLLDVDPGQQVQEEGADEQDHRHLPGPTLSPEDPPAQADQGQSGQGHQCTGRLGGPQGQELQQQVEPSPGRRGDGVDQVDDAGHQDGRRGQPAHPPGVPVGLVEVGRGWPRVAVGVGGHDGRVQAAHQSSPGHQALDDAG